MKHILLAIMLLTAFDVLSQDSINSHVEKKGFIAISGGLSFPQGDLADDDSRNEKAGYAKTGFTLMFLDFGYKLNKHFGAALTWISISNPVDENALANSLDNTTNDSWSVESGSIKYGGFFGGLFFSLPFEKIEMDLRVLGGFTNATYPEIKAIATSGIQLRQKKFSGSGYGYSFGTAIRYHISKKISLLSRFEYTGMEIEDIVITYYYHPTGPMADDYYEVEMPLTALSLTLGVAYRLK